MIKLDDVQKIIRLNETKTRRKISELLMEFGVPCCSVSYDVIADEVMMLNSDRAKYAKSIKILHEEIAGKYGQTASSAENVVRRAAKISFEKGSPELIDKVFKRAYNIEKGYATSKEFLFAVAEYVRYDTEEEE